MKLVLKGNWKGLMGMLSGYPDRIRYACERSAYDISLAFKERLISLAPDGDEYSKYVSSIEIVGLTGMKGVSSFAVVSMDIKERLGDVIDRDADRDATVVYIEASAASSKDTGIDLLMSVNPWPLNMLPSGIPRRGIRMMHRRVSPGEMSFVEKNARSFIRSNSGALRSYGFIFGRVDARDKDVGSMESMPDVLTLALRSELGVNSDYRPHWGPAIRWIRKHFFEILENDDEIKRALQDPSFRKHTFGGKIVSPDMDFRGFKRRTEKFRGVIRRA